jgi:hypothetical protein
MPQCWPVSQADSSAARAGKISPLIYGRAAAKNRADRNFRARAMPPIYGFGESETIEMLVIDATG